MGGCLSSVANRRRSDLEIQTSRANVVSANGQLRQHTIPVTVAQVLLNNNYNEQQQPELMEIGKVSVGYQQSFFLCNSDSLYYNEHIKAMDAEDELQADQIYFVLPSSKLRHPLTASDMAALAVKATIALQKTHSSSSDSLNRRRQSKKARISPVLEEVKTTNYKSPGHDGDETYGKYLSDREQMTVKNRNYSTGSAISLSSSSSSSRSGSVKKLQRYSSRRARMAIHAARSFKVRLSTIYEGSVLLF